ncbi:MAG: isoaspartyl peptidase/L-asparaginase [Synechococcales cyanobacterium]
MIPKLVIHGGAGSALEGEKSPDAVRSSLAAIVSEVYGALADGLAATAAVVMACRLLEDDPLFNAGTGSVLQSDGQVRMSASVMDGQRQSFSGVINVSRVQHPITMAAHLQTSPDRVVSDLGAAELARELTLPIYDPITPKRLREWVELQQQKVTELPQRVRTSLAMGTVGAVALDVQGSLAAATSTGGRGFERIGRVSDSATPAGNYATASAAVSCTGVGEDILDEGVATRIVVRVTDGLTLTEAVAKTFAEAKGRQRDFGAIAVSATGEIAWDTTTDLILVAAHDGHTIHLSL